MRSTGQNVRAGSAATHPATTPVPLSDEATPAPVLTAYRDAIADLLLEIAGHTGPEGAVKVAGVIDERVAESPMSTVLALTPGGPAAVVQRLLRDIWNFRPDERGPAVDLTTSIRIYLQSQIDLVWWSHLTPYLTHADLVNSVDLVDLDVLRRRGLLRFRYRHQPRGLVSRALRKAERRMLPGRGPNVAGVRFPYTRPSVVTSLNRLSLEFRAARGDRPAPALWVNSAARSVQHQNHLRDLGYAVVLPSAHCVGYAVDLDVPWLRRFDAHDTLRGLLTEHEAAGEFNVIDEGQVWHVCLSPSLVAKLSPIAGPEAG